MLNLKDKNILITGSKGFIGRHLSKFILDNHLYKTLTLVDINENDSINDEVINIKGTFSDYDTANRMLKNQNVVFHLAALVGVYNCLNNKTELKKINLDDTKKFIDIAISAGCEKIVFSSSSEVYGNSTEVPYQEGNGVSPVSDYAKYKIEIEKYLKNKSENDNTMVSIVRFFNVYGPNQRAEFVVPKFISMILANQDISINGDGTQTRSFTFVDDAVQGLIKAMQYNETKYEIFNIGNNDEVSIIMLANLILSMIPQASSKILFVKKENMDRYDSDRRVPSIEKAKKLLGFKPSIDLNEGLMKVLNEQG